MFSSIRYSGLRLFRVTARVDRATGKSAVSAEKNLKKKPPAVACRGLSVFQVFRDQKLR
jgi:hypothetical protein